ncbi:MAG: heavy metal translocating P-type ATPase [Lachnospiraceae bacterium]|nr:heavy metal translocating P-type ATPase [Lachnospiraceae bacterium]
MAKYNVKGMSCAACQIHVEKAVSKVEGVDNVNVSLLTNSMTVDGDASEKDIIKAVEKAGYSASPFSNTKENTEDDFSNEEKALEDTETPRLLSRLIKSIVFLTLLMYFSMGHMMLDFPVPAYIRNPISIGIIEMILTLIVLYINKDFFINGYRGLFNLSTNMDTLVALGSTAAFLYSFVALFVVINLVWNSDLNSGAAFAMKHMYFESAAMIPTLITIGKTLEAYSKGRTTDALKGLMKLAPKTAVILKDGVETTVNISEVKIGDTVLIKPGAKIPIDGIIIDGETSIDESALTGESIPVEKSINDTVSAATINTFGFIKVRATRVGRDTTLSKIIQMVSESSASKAPIARIADKISSIFVPTVILISILTFIGWMIAGVEFSTAFSRAVSVLVISCPCALGLATPVAIMVGNGLGAKNGLLFKNAAALEATGKTEIVCLDKTGTITNGEPKVTDIIPLTMDSDTLLKIAYSLEEKSEHPLAKAIREESTLKSIPLFETKDFKVTSGNGIEATISIDGKSVKFFGGKLSFIEKNIKGPISDIALKLDSLSKEGKTPLLFANENELFGIIAVSDTIKEDSIDAIKQLESMGIEVVMLTGDNEITAKTIANTAGIKNVISNVLPDEKDYCIKALQSIGQVTMVGDGINDALALTSADIGIAIGAGSDIAIDSADVVLEKNSLLDAASAIRLSKATLKNIKENLFWAFFYNMLCVPLAIGLYQALFHLNFEMKPVVGALAMSFSSVTVCLNALRLGLFKLHDNNSFKAERKHTKEIEDIISNIKLEKKKQEESKMTKTMKIEGMMCGHCEASVKSALEKVDGVTSANVSHEAGEAIVEMTEDISNDTLKEAVEAKDYKVIDIK